MWNIFTKAGEKSYQKKRKRKNSNSTQKKTVITPKIKEQIGNKNNIISNNSFVAKKRQDIANNTNAQKESLNKSLPNIHQSKLIKLNQIVKEELDDAFLGSFFVHKDISKILSVHNLEEKQVIELRKITFHINHLLSKTNFISINDYFFMDLNNNSVAFIIVLDKYQYFMLINKSKTNIGFINNIVKPIVINYYNKTIK